MKPHHNRPEIPSILNRPDTGLIELFQNDTLRPILKQLNLNWQMVFSHYCKNTNTAITDLDENAKVQLINNLLFKNQSIRNQFIGMAMGHFNTEELNAYFKNVGEFNRRIIQMLKQRLTDEL